MPGCFKQINHLFWLLKLLIIGLVTLLILSPGSGLAAVSFAHPPLQRPVSTSTLPPTDDKPLKIKPTISGVVALQSRDNFEGVIITSGTGETVQTDAQGAFEIRGSHSLTASYPGYMTAEATFSEPTGLIDLGKITLLAGDLNQDNVIDILDLAYVSNHLYAEDILADLNGDGVTDVLDLTLVASNYRQQGPLTNWQ